MRPRFLNKDEFAQVVRNTPLVSIDLIISNPGQCVLVGLRTNEPAKGKWFVPGGVVLKYERLADAFARIVKAEIGLEASIGDAKFVGGEFGDALGRDARGKRSDILFGRVDGHNAAPRTRGSICGDAQ